ncbi:MAG: hypothetical protein GY786_15920 [Proteobacteria bacterium]|nr:hypothetical protein [Pseudomonadota bacterium]
MSERKLLDQLRDKIRVKHYSIRTEKTYVDWSRRYILFHQKKHPKDMGASEIEEFLTDLEGCSGMGGNFFLTGMLDVFLELFWGRANDRFKSLDEMTQ